MDNAKHKIFMLQILRNIYSDVALASTLGFKGGTALMLFHGLPRFSVDLDFNIIEPNKEKEDEIFRKVRDILLKYGKIDDEAQKFFGPILALNYGKGERKLKVEISNRKQNSSYEVKSFMGINMLVMTIADMFAHKLCALLERSQLTNRDVFDCWFFMENRTPLNINLVEERTKMPLSDYLQKCIDFLDNLSNKNLLNGLGDLIDEKMKNFVRTKLCDETVMLLRFYQKFPITQ